MPSPRTHIIPAALLWLAALPALAQITPAGDAALRAALEAAEAGQPVALTQHPAQGWIEFSALRRTLDTLPAPQATEFLARYQGQAVAEAFRAEWLRAAYRRGEWAAIRTAWSPAITETALRCIELDARQHGGDTGPEWINDVQAIWRSSGASLPDECDAPFAALAARGGLTDALRWQRLERAAAEGQHAMMRAIARRLPPEQRALAEDYAAFIQSPHARALNWPKTARSRSIAVLGLTRLARRRPLEAAAHEKQVLMSDVVPLADLADVCGNFHYFAKGNVGALAKKLADLLRAGNFSPPRSRELETMRWDRTVQPMVHAMQQLGFTIPQCATPVISKPLSINRY